MRLSIGLLTRIDPLTVYVNLLSWSFAKSWTAYIPKHDTVCVDLLGILCLTHTNNVSIWMHEWRSIHGYVLLCRLFCTEPELCDYRPAPCIVYLVAVKVCCGKSKVRLFVCLYTREAVETDESVARQLIGSCRRTCQAREVFDAPYPIQPFD
jgi:hypothetical protein